MPRWPCCPRRVSAVTTLTSVLSPLGIGPDHMGAVKAAKRDIWHGCLDFLGPGTRNNEGRHTDGCGSPYSGDGKALRLHMPCIAFTSRRLISGEKHGQNLLHRTPAHAQNAGWSPPPNVPHFGASKLCCKIRGQEHIASSEPAIGKNEDAQILNPEEVAQVEERWVAEGIVDPGLVNDAAFVAAERDDASSAASLSSSEDDRDASSIDLALPDLTSARRIIDPPNGLVFITPWRMPCGP